MLSRYIFQSTYKRIQKQRCQISSFHVTKNNDVLKQETRFKGRCQTILQQH